MEKRAALSRGFSILAKPIGPICNLSCKYCFYLEKELLYPDLARSSDWILSEEILEEYVRQYIDSQPAPTITFGWQGGEPTLVGVDYFRKIVALQQKYAHGKQIENTLQTNGILLDDEWCEFLARNHFLVGLSVDGPKHLHDRYRVDRGGAPSFEKVMRSVGCLKKHGVAFNTLTVVQNSNSQHALEVYRFLRELGHNFLQFIPIVERLSAKPLSDGIALASPRSIASAQVTEWSVNPQQYGKFLCAIFDEWVRNDVGRIFVQLFDVTLAAWVGMEPALCVFQQTCGKSGVLEHNGDIYSCDHFVYPEDKLGNIMEQPLPALLNSEQQARFGRDKRDSLPGCCLDCDVRFVCNGECPKHRFVQMANGEKNRNYLCPAYKRFFAHVAPYMTFMAKEIDAKRPPANIMSWIRQTEPGRPGRNDLCPCGSGKKFKRCCGRS
jgi:uncharacterized protein